MESKLGKGSTFWLTAVLGKGSVTTSIADTQPWENDENLLRRKHAGKCILLVEDDPINAEVARLLCTNVGLVMDLASNGADALDLVQRNDYALILMDMQKPVMDGVAATHAIRRLANRQTTPILAMTANAFVEDREQCLSAGMIDFVAKPFEPADVFRALLTWLDNARTTHQAVSG